MSSSSHQVYGAAREHARRRARRWCRRRRRPSPSGSVHVDQRACTTSCRCCCRRTCRATASKSRGSCDANSVVPVSSHSLTPDFSDSGPRTRRPSCRRRPRGARPGRPGTRRSPPGSPDVQRLVARAAVGQRLGGEQRRARGRDRRLGADGVARRAARSATACPPCHRRRAVPAVPAAPPAPRGPARPAAPPPVADSPPLPGGGRPLPPRRRSRTSPRIPVRSAAGRSRPSTHARAAQIRSEEARRGKSPVTIARVSPPAGRAAHDADTACALKTAGVETICHVHLKGRHRYARRVEADLLGHRVAPRPARLRHAGQQRDGPPALRAHHPGRRQPRVAFATEARETALLSMRGACSITVDGTRYDIGLHDAIYIPRGSAVVVDDGDRRGRPGRVRRRGERHYPLQVIRYAELWHGPEAASSAPAARRPRAISTSSSATT